MFTRSDRKRDASDGGGTLAGQVRVLVVGDAGVGKSSIVHLIVQGSPIARPRRTIGCSVDVKHVAYGDFDSISNNTVSSKERDFFVELWDISGHERYKDCRSLFYSQINGVIFVHDLSQRKTKSNLQKWASDLATFGTFSAPLSSGNLFGIPVPFLVIANKADIAPKNGGSSGNLVDVARHWVEKQGFLSSSDELPIAESFPGSGLVASAKEGRLDMESVKKFFVALIRRRYFAEDTTSMPLHTWNSITRNPSPYHSRTSSLTEAETMASHTGNSSSSDLAKYVASLPAQLTLLPPPLPQPNPYPQRPLIANDVMPTMNFSSPSLAKASSISRSDMIV